MSYEEPRVARRSASHGALHGSYAIPTRAGSAIPDPVHHLVPYFKPLRSIREHGHTFLDPAASADGMLRKTTETGNIGLFSINTGRPTALRPRTSLAAVRLPHRPFSRSSDRPPGHNDRNRLPSYRDSASEIISMYGSDHQSSSKSNSSTLSPPWDDSGQRSYSMTTCGSKYYAFPRNNAIQLAHEYQAGAQRPRSPYPYPTRLPRPGIRPSSPALTENGIVDYSRMVEIDRIPQRTIHHPHKTLFPYKTTRDQAGPLSMRQGINQSTRSLSDDLGSTRQFPSPMPRRPLLPDHHHPWGLRPRDRLGSDSSEQSLRTVSLSSASVVYGCAPPQMPRMQVSEKKPPIFYDYSEDFEDALDPPPELSIANPTPTRISKSFCPGIPDDRCDASSESTDEGVGHIVDSLQRMTMIESVEDQREHDEGFGLEHYRPVSQLYRRGGPAKSSFYEPGEQALPSNPVVPQLAHMTGNSNVSVATLDGHEDAVKVHQMNDADQVTESLNNALVSEASTVESPLDPDTPSLDIKMPLAEATCFDDDGPIFPEKNERTDDTKGVEPLKEVLEPRVESTESVVPVVRRSGLASCASAMLADPYSSRRKDSRLFSLSSGLSDLASFVKYVDMHMQSLDSDNTEQHRKSLPGSRSAPDSNHGRNFNQIVQETSAPPRTSSLAHHRIYVGRRTNTPAPVDELEQYQVVSTRSGPTLVPQPISPVKMLRVKNSIPQLMKALPPLPGYSPASESPFNPTIVPVEFEPFEFSRLTDARSTLIEPFESGSHDEHAPEGYNPLAFERGLCKPKLRLKNSTSLAPGNVRRVKDGPSAQGDAAVSGHSEKRIPTIGDYSTAPVKRRLPIKILRPALSSVLIEDSGTIKRRPGIDKSSTVSEIASSQPVDLFSTSTKFKVAIQDAGPPPEQPRSSDEEHGSVPVVNRPSAGRIQRVTIVDESRGVSLDTHLDAMHSPRPKVEAAAEDEMQSFFSDSFVRPRRGLRKKLSTLKSRLTESRHHHQHPPKGNVDTHETNGNKITQPDTTAHAPTAFRDLLIGMSPMKGHHPVTPTRTVRSRWEKLIQGAKYRLRTWGINRNKGE